MPGPGIADPGPGPGIGAQGSRYAVRFQGFKGRPGRPGSAGDRIAQGIAQGDQGINQGHFPGEKKPGAAAGFLAPGWRLGVDVSGLVSHRNQVIQARPGGIVFRE